jgi:fructuronate reductase
MSKRLSLENIDDLPAHVVRPKYDVSQHKVGIVHIGIGAFHRGHQAVFTDDAIAYSGGDWRITGVSLRSATVSEQLNPQQGLYTVTTKFNGQQETRLIGAVDGVLVAPSNPKAVIELLASPQTKVVTLTVTEKGYHYDMTTNMLLAKNADIQHDIKHPESPISMPGFLVAACVARMDTNQKLSVISCDNLPENGAVTKTVVIGLAKYISEDLVAWIEENVSFSSSMVDRIVPAVTQQNITQTGISLGMLDQAMIQTETFKQWVIQDNFCTPTPDWESAGAIIVKNVEQYEKLKLRTLNGSHSTLAYMGVLLGYKWIHEAISNPLLLSITKHLMQHETGPSLQTPMGFDLASYQAQTIARFQNDEIAYATQQVAMDGSQKIVQRIFAPITDIIASETGVANNANPSDAYKVLVSVVASWMVYLRGKDEAGNTYDINDPLSESLSALAQKHQNSPTDYVNAICKQTSVMPLNLQNNSAFIEALVSVITAIDNNGLDAHLQSIVK